MMKRLRLLLATATGAALLLGGTGLQAANAAGSDFNGAASSDAYVPLDKEIQVTVTLKLKDPATATGISGTVTPPGKSDRPVAFGDWAKSGSEAPVNGTFGIGKDDPAGDWKLNIKVTRGTSTGDNSFTIKVTAKQGITAASVTPNPVKLRKGKDVKVAVEATANGASTVSAKLVSDETGEYYDLGALDSNNDGTYSGVTYMADDSTAGAWTLEVYATRAGQTLKGVSSFTVEEPTGGVSKKAKARITLQAPAKVAQGKRFKVSGKVLRGSAAYKGAAVEVYFKAKGTKKYKLMGLVKATSTGKYAKQFKAAKDGYWRAKVESTSTTRSALSPQDFVDVR